MNEGLTVDIVQAEHTSGSIENNLKMMCDYISSAHSDLVVFPEMFLTGYTLGRDVHDLSISVDDSILESLVDTVSKEERSVLFGFPRRSDRIRGQIHNSAMLISPEGVAGTYDKMHLVDFGPFEEWAYFTPGDHPYMFSLNGINIGVIICYDIFFPEITKYYALDGADAVICISASPSVTREFFESVMRARAIESTVYFLYSNLVGFDSRMDFWGGSEIIDPAGNTISKGGYFQEEVVSGSIDPEIIRIARANRPTLRDTRALFCGLKEYFRKK